MYCKQIQKTKNKNTTPQVFRILTYVQNNNNWNPAVTSPLNLTILCDKKEVVNMMNTKGDK